MKVDVKQKEENKKTKPFPRLMISNLGTLVFFTKFGCGITISSAHHHTGYESTCWHMPDFEDFEGEVTLSND